MNEILHYGTKRHSGRYPWGSGERPFQGEDHGKFMDQSRDSDIRIKAGSKAYRISATNKLSDTAKNATYISLLKSDQYQYAEFAAMGDAGIATYRFKTDNGNENRPYLMDLKIQNDIVAPSYQKSFEAFVDVIRDVGIKKVADDIYNTKGGDVPSIKYKEFMKAAKNLKLQEAREKAYVAFVSSFMKDTESRKKFIDLLKKQGYNAIIDENDVKFNTNRSIKSATILFDQNDVKETKVQPLSEEDINWLSSNFWGGEYKSNPKWDEYFDKVKHGIMMNNIFLNPTEYLASLGCDMNIDLTHYGTKHHSGRYPWGSGERPYQGDGGKRQGYFARKRAERQRQEVLKKARAAAETKRRYEAEKERAINSGDIKFAYENRYRLTDAELNKVLQRVDMNRKLESALKDLSKTSGDKPSSKSNAKENKEYLKLKEKFPGFDNFMGNVGTINHWMATGLNTYQNIQTIQKIFNGQSQKKEQQKPKEEKKKK